MIIEVRLYNETIGAVEWNDNRGSATFQYSTSFLDSNIEPSPLMMPTQERIFETSRDHINFHDLPYLLSDSLPDNFGNIMMKEWLRQRQISIDSINPVDRLSYVGRRGMGALEYEPIKHSYESDYSIHVGDIVKVAEKVLERKEETSYTDLDKESLSDILRIGSSAGGARAKALIAIKTNDNDEILEIRPGDIIQPKGYSYWLLKIDGANEKTLGEGEGIGKIEYAYYLLAKKCGINISESRLHEENNRFHFLTKRFDRADQGEKIHMQTFGALAGIDYRIPKVTSYENLFRVMKRLRLPYNQFEQQFRRSVFNVVMRNHDDHVKNFSFLMDKSGKWRISPAYDVNYSYSKGGTWTNTHQSSINGKFDNFTREDVLTLGSSFGIKKAKDIVDEISSIASDWPTIAAGLDIPKKEILSIAKTLVYL